MNKIEYLRQLGNETRLRLVAVLLERELCVCELEEILQERQVNITKHLNKLKATGMVGVRREKQRGFHYLSHALLAEQDLMAFVRTLRETEPLLQEDDARFKHHETIKDQQVYVCNMFKKETLS